MSEPKPHARTMILRLLKQRPGQSAHDLARLLSITPVAVRKHMDQLTQEGLVSVELRRQPVGRPSYVYRLTGVAGERFPQGYRQMLLDLLQDLATMDGEQKVKRLLEGRSERQRQSYERRLGAAPLPDRLRELARLRNEDGYMTELEEDENSYLFRQYNCPVEDVSRHFQQTCGCEIDMLRDLLHVKHIERIEAARDGAPSCTYRIPKGR